MTPKQFYYSVSRADLISVCKAAKTNLANFKQIVAGGSVGRDLAQRLTLSSGGRMTELEILYPERYEERP